MASINAGRCHFSYNSLTDQAHVDSSQAITSKAWRPWMMRYEKLKSYGGRCLLEYADLSEK